MKERKLTPEMLDMIPPVGESWKVLRAYGPGQVLLGITVLLNIFPFAAVKPMLGEGNHVGWDISYYFVQGAPKEKVIAALLKKQASLCFSRGICYVSNTAFTSAPVIM